MNGLLQSPYHWVVESPLEPCTTTVFFIAQLCYVFDRTDAPPQFTHICITVTGGETDLDVALGFLGRFRGSFWTKSYVFLRLEENQGSIAEPHLKDRCRNFI